MKKSFVLLGCLLCVCAAAQARGTRAAAQNARPAAESMPAVAALPSQTDALAQAVKRQASEARERMEMQQGCRPFWQKHPAQIAAIPALAKEACAVFKRVGRNCADLGSYVYRDVQYKVAGRKGNYLLSGYRKGFIKDPEEISYIMTLQDSLILGVGPAVFTFLPEEYWVNSPDLGQTYDFCLNVKVGDPKMYGYVCDHSLPAMESALREIIENEPYLDAEN